MTRSAAVPPASTATDPPTDPSGVLSTATPAVKAMKSAIDSESAAMSKAPTTRRSVTMAATAAWLDTSENAVSMYDSVERSAIVRLRRSTRSSCQVTAS